MIKLKKCLVSIQRLLDRCVDRLAPMCVNGGHRQHGSIVTNVYGHKYCWHPDCMAENFNEVKDNEKA